MLRLSTATIAVFLALMLIAPADAQLSGLMKGGGAGGLLGGGMPNIGATGAGNAAGLLGYCLKNQLLGAGSANGASSALSALAGRKGVAGSKAYSDGEAGTIVTGQGQQSLSMNGLGDQVKSKVCGMVLQHAKTLL